MFLDPSSQHLNQFRQTVEIPVRLQSVLIEGSNRRCLISPGIQILSQQIVHPEFDLYIHHVLSKGFIELFGKTSLKKWFWIMQHEGDAEVSLAGGPSFPLKVNEHFFVRTGGAKENRFSFAQGRSVIVMISLKPTGEKMVKQYYTDLWKRLQRVNKRIFCGESIYIDQFYREGLIMPTVVPVLLNAFLSERVRMLLLLFNLQLINAPQFTGISAALERKVMLAKQLLDQHPGEAWTLRKLARCAGWNMQDLKVVFKKVYLTTPIQYLRQARLQLGLLLLRSTTKTIVDISRTCGFKQPHHFIRVFKELTGKTPGEVRKTLKINS